MPNERIAFFPSKTRAAVLMRLVLRERASSLREKHTDRD